MMCSRRGGGGDEEFGAGAGEKEDAREDTALAAEGGEDMGEKG